MTDKGLARRWWSAFFEALEGDLERAGMLREAALASDLGRWTAALTHVVVTALEAMGFTCAAKGHRCTRLPVRRQEYLGLDVIALPAGGDGWRLPAVACELENARRAERIAYSLWKVLCVRARLRVVFCYRRDLSAAGDLVAELARAVVEPMAIPDRLALGGETLVVVGSRGEAGSFPYGFFRAWKLDANTGRFRHFARE